MDPLIVIVWVCVFVFIITSVLTLLHVSGIYQLPNKDHGGALFKALILEIVIISIAAFAGVLKLPFYGSETSEKPTETFEAWWGNQ